MRIISLGILFLLMCILTACSNHSSQHNFKATEHYFNHIKHDPLKLQMFLFDFPKGGDIHNHLSGAVYAETVIKFAEHDGLCVDPITLVVTKNPQCKTQYKLENLKNNYDLYTKLVNNWSLRKFGRTAKESRNDFFDDFLRDASALNPKRGEILAQIVQRNAMQHIDYVELLVLPKTSAALALAAKVPVNDNYAQANSYLLKHGAKKLVDQMQQQIAGWVQQKNKILQCGTPQAQPGCQVVVGFQTITLRALPNNLVFPQLVLAFMLAKQAKQVVGINMVGPEDAPLTLQNYRQQMQMVDYLHKLYPKVKISLHAGELTMGLVTPENLQFHIHDAVFTAHANRIGHGVDIAYEKDAANTLRYMAKQHIAIEIALTSNADLLNVTGKAHPITLYLQYHVPVTLNTDDEGELRIDLTHEYKRAVMEYGFSYPTLKMFARNALTYNFLPGNSLWQNAKQLKPVTACAGDRLGAQTISPSCSKFLRANPKAKVQWHLEQQFNAFEKQIALQANG
jgi:adenosine deaminase